MEKVVNVTGIVAREIADNAAGPIEEHDTYFMHDEEHRLYAWIAVPHDRYKHATMIMLARVTADDTVIIETDLTDRPLYQSLIDAGVPRSRIIRAYAGKTQPEP